MKKLFALLFSLLLLTPLPSYGQTLEIVNFKDGGGVGITRKLPACIEISVTNEMDGQAGYERTMPKIHVQNNCEADFTITGFENASSTLSKYWPVNKPGARISLQRGKEEVVLMYNPSGGKCGAKAELAQTCSAFDIPSGFSWEFFLYNQGLKIQSTEGDFVSFSLGSGKISYGRGMAEKPKEWWNNYAETEKDLHPTIRGGVLSVVSHKLVAEKNWEEAYFWASIAGSGKVKHALFERDLSSTHLNAEQKAVIDKRVADYIAAHPHLKNENGEQKSE